MFHFVADLFFSFCFDFALYHQCSSDHFFSLSFSMCVSELLIPWLLIVRAESNRQVQWFSESDVSDINESDSRPASPVTVLEAVDGVQPELQHTQKESELVSKSSTSSLCLHIYIFNYKFIFVARNEHVFWPSLLSTKAHILFFTHSQTFTDIFRIFISFCGVSI